VGTDIHMIVQTHHDGVWLDSSARVIEDRSYVHFGILAGVRDSRFPPVRPLRGLPPDVAEPEEYAGSRLGEHSRSWLLVSELDEYFEANPTLREDPWVNSGELFEIVAEWRALSRTGDGSDVRIVFGFDS